MMHAKALTEGFRSAAKDYLLLIEKDYSRAAVLRLVGDHYQLTSVQRSMIYRGVVGTQVASLRVKKKIFSITDESTSIDALNVLYTVANYLYGRVLFISTDSWLRDAGEVHGNGMPSGRRGTKFDAALELTLEWLVGQRPEKVTFYIDEPVSMSGRLASRIRSELHTLRIQGTAVTVHSADFALKQACDGVIATSDSTIIDSASRPVCDLAHEIIKARYAPELIDLRALVLGECV